MAKRLTICFVCYGNLCRSPMAAAMLKDMLQRDAELGRLEVDVCSAGTGAVPGYPASPNARRVMQEMGISLDDHTARPVSGEVLKKADLIVALDGHVGEELRRGYPETGGKTCVIEIADPYAYPVEVYRECAAEISEILLSRVLPLVRRLARG